MSPESCVFRSHKLLKAEISAWRNLFHLLESNCLVITDHLFGACIVVQCTLRRHVTLFVTFPTDEGSLEESSSTPVRSSLKRLIYPPWVLVAKQLELEIILGSDFRESNWLVVPVLHGLLGLAARPKRPPYRRSERTVQLGEPWEETGCFRENSSVSLKVQHNSKSSSSS
eukprot:IDg1731t1